MSKIQKLVYIHTQPKIVCPIRSQKSLPGNGSSYAAKVILPFRSHPCSIFDKSNWHNREHMISETSLLLIWIISHYKKSVLGLFYQTFSLSILHSLGLRRCWRCYMYKLYSQIIYLTNLSIVFNSFIQFLYRWPYIRAFSSPWLLMKPIFDLLAFYFFPSLNNFHLLSFILRDWFYGVSFFSPSITTLSHVLPVMLLVITNSYRHYEKVMLGQRSPQTDF